MGSCLSKLKKGKVANLESKKEKHPMIHEGTKLPKAPRVRINHDNDNDKKMLKNPMESPQMHFSSGVLVSHPGFPSTTALVTGVPEESHGFQLSHSMDRISIDESLKGSIEKAGMYQDQPSIELEAQNDAVKLSEKFIERKRSKSPEDKRSRSQPPMKDRWSEKSFPGITVEQYSDNSIKRMSSSEMLKGNKVSVGRQHFQALNLESIVDKIVEQENESGGSSPLKSRDVIDDQNNFSQTINRFDPSFMKEDETLQLNATSKLGKIFHESPVPPRRPIEIEMFNFETPEVYNHSIIDLQQICEGQSRAGVSMSASSAKRGYYRSHNKINLLKLNRSKQDCLQLPTDDIKKRSKTAENYMLTANYAHKSSRLNQDKSIVMDTRDDINRVDMSYMDISIRSVTQSRSVASRRLRSVQSKSNSRSQNKSCMLDDDKEPKLNTTLNTTYIKNIEMITPMKLKGLKELNVKIEGMRTRINDYVLLKTIGSGGWSDQVYMAVHMITKQKYVGR